MSFLRQNLDNVAIHDFMAQRHHLAVHFCADALVTDFRVNRVREVNVSSLGERGLAVLGDDAVGDRLGLDRGQLIAFQADESVGQPDHRRRANLHMEIGPLALDQLFEPRVELGHDR